MEDAKVTWTGLEGKLLKAAEILIEVKKEMPLRERIKLCYALELVHDVRKSIIDELAQGNFDDLYRCRIEWKREGWAEPVPPAPPFTEFYEDDKAAANKKSKKSKRSQKSFSSSERYRVIKILPPKLSQ